MALFRIRPAAAADARFLGDMLVEASNWSAASARPRVAVLEDPHVFRYIVGWKRPGDFGSVAVDENGTALGACWGRLFPADEPGYGFIAAGVPELTLGVGSQWRTRGVGRALLRAVAEQAVAAGHNRLSLSVERANFAQRLYLGEGFVTVESGENSDTMVRSVN